MCTVTWLNYLCALWRDVTVCVYLTWRNYLCALWRLCDAICTVTDCTEVSELVDKVAHLVEWAGTSLKNGIYVCCEICVQAPLKDEHVSVASRARNTYQLSAKCPQKWLNIVLSVRKRRLDLVEEYIQWHLKWNDIWIYIKFALKFWLRDHFQLYF
jgi:hypothetical protein